MGFLVAQTTLVNDETRRDALNRRFKAPPSGYPDVKGSNRSAERNDLSIRYLLLSRNLLVPLFNRKTQGHTGGSNIWATRRENGKRCWRINEPGSSERNLDDCPWNDRGM